MQFDTAVLGCAVRVIWVGAIKPCGGDGRKVIQVSGTIARHIALQLAFIDGKDGVAPIIDSGIASVGDFHKTGL